MRFEFGVKPLWRVVGALPIMAVMSGKSGKRETANKPSGNTRRQSAKTDGAFGKENIEQTVSEEDRNIDNAVRKKEEKEA